MAPEIKKIVLDGIEFLPDITDTPLWAMLDPDRNMQSKKPDRQLAGLYAALRQRENYYQENTPTAFGDPQYSLYCGVVKGFLMAMEAEENDVAGQIVIRNSRNGKKLLVIDKPTRPASYFEDLRSNRELLRELGF